MTYSATETSVQDGSPVLLYEFTRGTTTYRYTSGDQAVTAESNPYTQAALMCPAIETSTEQVRNAIEVTCPRTFAIAQMLPCSDVIGLTLRRMHRKDGAAEIAMVWKGRVLNTKWNGAEGSLHCEPVSVSLDRPSLSRGCNRSCTYALFRRGCGLDKDAFRVDTTISAISGQDVTLAAVGAYPYPGGWVEKQNADGSYERSFIESSSGAVMTLMELLKGAAVSDAVSVYPGCDHTRQTCNDVYGNLDNNGSVMPNAPAKNPFGSESIY